MNIVVVGHGLTPIGKSWGRVIDKNIVIRMWNWHWQSVLDYGSAYHYGFYEISPVEMKRFYRHNTRKPTISWLAESLHKAYFGDLPAGKTIQLDSTRWVDMARELGGVGENNKYLKLTRGVRAASWAIEQLPTTVILVGFDNMRAGIGLSIAEGFPPEYVACPAGFPFRDYVGGSTKYSSHDYAVEGPFLQQLADLNGVRLVHAQDLWR